MTSKMDEADNPGFWIERSIALRQSGRLDAAVEACKRALAIAPHDDGALASLAHALRWQGRYDDALEVAGRAIAAAPGSATARFQYAASLEGLGRAEEAVAAYRYALRLKPDFAEAWSNLGNVLAELKRDDEALEAYRRSAVHGPAIAPVWSNLGAALRQAGLPEEAADACRRATELDPDNAQAWTNLGLALHDCARPDEAVSALVRATDLDRGSTAYRNLGDVLDACGRVSEAEQAYRRALAAAPPTAALLTRFGEFLKKLGREEAALDVFQRALAINPGEVAALAEVGEWLGRSGGPRESEGHYRAAVAALQAAARSGDAESALDHEFRIYRGFVRHTESEAHYRHCFSHWQAELSALGERFRDRQEERDPSPREIAFFLHAGHVLGHTEVLLKLLEQAPREADGGITPRVYVLGACDEAFASRVRKLDIPLVLAEQEAPRGKAASILQRFLWLKARFRKDRIRTCVWVTSPLWVSFAFSMRLAPVQIFWALRFHPVAGPFIDGYITYGSARETERIIAQQPWRVCPMPLTLETAIPDAATVAEVRRLLPEGMLLGTLARPEKINSAPFLECVAGILAANPNAHYVWTGRSEHPGIARFFRAAGVGDRCHFVGWVDTKVYVAALDLFLESFPLGTGVVPYQALGAGTPVLSYFAPATLFGVNFWHEFADGAPANLERYPILCARTPEEYVQMANALIADANLRAQAAERGKRFFNEEFARTPAYARRFLDTITDISERTIAGRQTGAPQSERP